MAALKVAVTRVRLGVDPGQRSAGSCRRVASWAQLSSWIGEVVNELGRQLLAGPVQRLLWRQRDAEPLDDGPISTRRAALRWIKSCARPLAVRLTDALHDLAPAVALTAWLVARRGASARNLSGMLTLTAEHSRLIITQARSSPLDSNQGKAAVAVTDSRGRRGGTPNPGLGTWARHRHRDVSGGWLRPTVFGAVDGLVTNASLIAGVGGGGVSAHTIVLTGLAGLVAGAFSMGTGEYVSVTNQNELVHAEVALERDMHDRFPEQEHAELAERFTTYGADPDTARRMAEAVSQDPDRALWLHARDELGVDPNDLPSPLLAGGASLVAFSLGALWPLLPYLLGYGALPAALGVTAVALLAGGGTVGRLTGRPLLRGGLRQLALGALAVSVTYGVGHLIGASAV